MKLKGSKIGGGSWTSLGLPSIFLFCLFFFLAGFFGASLFSQQVHQHCFAAFSKVCYLYLFYNYGSGVHVIIILFFLCVRQESPTSNLRPRTWELVEEKIEFKGLPHGDSGGDSVEAIPFQVCMPGS